MADQKITQLTAYTAIIDTDVVPLVDITATETKKTTWANIKSVLGSFFNSAVTWTVTTADANLTVGAGILANKGTLLTMTLPTTAAAGTTIRIAGMNAGLWQVAQNANQYIKFGNQTSTTGVTGYIASVLTYDAVEMVCIVADTGWVVVSSVGNITVA